jgi:hypothetical protein
MTIIELFALFGIIGIACLLIAVASLWVRRA